MKRLFNVRFVLTVLLLVSMAFAGYSIYYKTKSWGFTFSPKKLTNVWTVEAHIAFEPNGYPIKVSMAIPATSSEYKVLNEEIIATNYKIKKINNGVNKIELTNKAQEVPQNIYYQVMLYDNEDGKGKVKAPAPQAPKKPILDEQRSVLAKEIIKSANALPGDKVQQIIRFFNIEPMESVAMAYLPAKRSPKIMADTISDILALQGIPTRMVRGVMLEESRSSVAPDLMLEAYVENRWMIYNLLTGKKGIPESFVIFQRGGESLLDIEGGENSTIKFSVIKSVSSNLGMASARSKVADNEKLYEYSIYNLPILTQNMIKWLMVFPIGILVVVLMRNVVGLKTMGTFTPMLVAMALTQTGFWQGLLGFAIIVGLGLLIRGVLSKLNLLLVPRISAVVIFVILIMQIMTILGDRFTFEILSSAAFFPIIIMAWIIERASITWEEDGAANAGQEIFYSMLVAIIVYFVIVSENIRYIMFAFNELNLVVLFVVMLLGTYTGYRLTELKRFSPIVRPVRRSKTN